MAELTGGQIIGKIWKEEGVEFIAGIHGGSVFELMRVADEENIKMLHLRDEQTGAYMADGWGRVTGRPGVCFAHSAMGVLNMMSGLLNAHLCRAPVVAFVGRHALSEDGWLPSQEAYQAEISQTFTKWSKCIVDLSTMSFFVQKAFRDAATHPRGPVLIELPRDLYIQTVDEKTQKGYLPLERSAPMPKAQGDPAMIEKAVRMLLEAERPIVVGGEGIYWSQASEELREFVELLRIPVHTKRIARGAVPEDHPLAFRGEYGRPLNHRADVMVGFGIFMGRGENFAQPPMYPPTAKYILVSDLEQDLQARIPTAVRILGDSKVVLRQMLDCARDIIKEPPERGEWLDVLTKAKEAYLVRQQEQKERVRDARPINPHFLSYELVDFLDDDATIIQDSFFFSHFTSAKLQAKFPGHILDAGGAAGVGHSIGMALGVQLARPGKQVVTLQGDGGLGISGFDLESAARYNLPIVCVLSNNSSWMSRELQNPEYKGRLALPTKDSWGMLPDIRYDRMFVEMGCHGEFVTEPEEIKPALERAFNSGKPALVNVIPDSKVIPGFLTRGMDGQNVRVGGQRPGDKSI